MSLFSSPLVSSTYSSLSDESQQQASTSVNKVNSNKMYVAPSKKVKKSCESLVGALTQSRPVSNEEKNENDEILPIPIDSSVLLDDDEFKSFMKVSISVHEDG